MPPASSSPAHANGGAQVAGVGSTTEPTRRSEFYTDAPTLNIMAPFLLVPMGVLGATSEECLGMCDFSLQTTKSRPAKVGDKLTTQNFGTGTHGFAAPEDPTTAVCLLPGTELAFSGDVVAPGLSVRHTLAIFRQVNKETPRAHHDALEFPDGTIVLLTMVCDGQEATVLQLPAQPTTVAEAEAQKRAAYLG
jgi:hypothetical protein